MATPKIKAYRLEQNYNPTTDTDVRPMVDDEMLPVSEKNLNLMDVEECVGVEERGDGRMVVNVLQDVPAHPGVAAETGSRWSDYLPVRMDTSSVSYLATMPVCCDGWRMGKGNFRLYVRVCNREPSSDSASSFYGGLEDGGFFEAEENNGAIDTWTELDGRLWDYETETVKVYEVKGQDGTVVRYCSGFKVDSVTGVNEYGLTDYSLIPDASAVTRIYQSDYAVFRIGEAVKHASMGSPFTGGYQGYMPIALAPGDEATGLLGHSPNRIFVRFRPFCELWDDRDSWPGESDSLSGPMDGWDQGMATPPEDRQDEYAEGDWNMAPSRYCAPFGDIYNGTRTGLRLDMDSSGTRRFGVRMNYYEGNYQYQRAVYPMRAAVIRSSSYRAEFRRGLAGVPAAYTFDPAYPQADVAISPSWISDGPAAPILMEQIPVYDPFAVQSGPLRPVRWVLRAMEPGVQTYELTMSGDVMPVVFRPDYYAKSSSVAEYAYPDEAVVAYSEAGERLGRPFDFNYDYSLDSMDMSASPSGIRDFFYRTRRGTWNDGTIVAPPGCHPEMFAAVQAGDPGNSKAVYIRESRLAVRPGYGIGGEEDRYWTLERSDSGGAATAWFEVPETDRAGIDLGMGWRLYSDGVQLGHQDHDGSPQSDRDGHTVSLEGWTFAVSVVEGNDAPNDLMLLYYRREAVSSDPVLAPASRWNGGLDNDGRRPSSASGLSYYDASGNAVSGISAGDDASGLLVSACPCLGFRIPCYRKIRKARLFVSSHPMWMGGHLNNDLDVFVGNRRYSGVNTSSQMVDGVYPNYVRSGWSPLYSGGAVLFESAQETWDYFYMMDFVTVSDAELKGVMESKWAETSCNAPDHCSDAFLRLYYRKVRCNVAHFDGIYAPSRAVMRNTTVQGGVRYRVVDDEDFPDCVGKRWVTRNDRYTPSVFESGYGRLPETAWNTETGKENLVRLREIQCAQGEAFRVDVSSDRVALLSMSYTESEQRHLLMCLENGYSGGTARISSSWAELSGLVRVHARMKEKDGAWILQMGLENSQPGSAAEAMFFDGVDWVDFPPLGDVLDGATLEELEGNSASSGDGLPAGSGFPAGRLFRRIRYRGDDKWRRDVYFELLCYRYPSYNGEGETPSRAEIMVYGVDR